MNQYTTIEKMKQMRLSGMAEAYFNSLNTRNEAPYSNDEFIALLIDLEWDNRLNNKIKTLIEKATFREQANVRNINYQHPRNLDRNVFERIISLNFMQNRENIIITGATGTGKSYLAQAIGMHACEMTKKVMYFNTSRLMDQIKLDKIQGKYLQFMKKIQNTDLLILDDFGLTLIDQMQRQALLDIVEHRYEKSSIILTSQIPVAEWHGLIGEDTVADAILDRLVYSSHRIELEGESLRKNKLKKE